jgi:dihydrofolate synthase/folylpolyglutamate synthase
VRSPSQVNRLRIEYYRMSAEIDSILKQFERFGVNLGLDRIRRLLDDLGNPQQQVPLIHVAGTNGKGSVCAYLSAILKAAGYRVGRYTSPHLIDWTERICIDDRPISEPKLTEVLSQVRDAIAPDAETPTQFEVITAAAWLHFARERVDVAVMEVGLGGRLDATNAIDLPLVSVITSIGWEHWQRLGPTLADIAGEKAGILKSDCPAVVGNLPSEAIAVVRAKIAELGCPAVFPAPAVPVADPPDDRQWVRAEGIQYPLPLLGDVQLQNSALAIAAIRVLRDRGWNIDDRAIVEGMSLAQWPGRLQYFMFHNTKILIDGAHNTEAAKVLRRYADRLDFTENRITWVMGMLSTKDREGIFKTLLRSGNRLYLVPVPDHSSAIPEELAELAAQICPDLAEIRCFPDVIPALEAAIDLEESLTILCGSLYLLGYFLGKMR